MVCFEGVSPFIFRIELTFLENQTETAVLYLFNLYSFLWDNVYSSPEFKKKGGTSLEYLCKFICI